MADFEFIPAPGVILVEEVTDSDTPVKTSNNDDGNVLKGRVLAIGPSLLTDFNAVLKTQDYCRVGDIIFFLSYNERNYDWIKIKNRKYYVVKIQDIRGKLNG